MRKRKEKDRQWKPLEMETEKKINIQKEERKYLDSGNSWNTNVQEKKDNLTSKDREREKTIKT
jgi:hypothetical protein